ncbi:MAG: glycosyltransferase [candidate division Zixibacteria bacterium]|nr:glycosyltransferase [candidate division Zixibacteria bacterium]
MKAFRKFETALRNNLKEWIKELGEVDVLVGIPSFNSEETIEGVVTACALGLKEHLGDRRSAIIVSDGGSLDDTRERANQARLPEDVKRMVAIYRGMPGKGTSFRAIFEAARLLKADCCVVVDSDLKSISPEWVKLLASPILQKKAGFVTPFYLRHKHDGSITNHIVYPMTRALYGKRIRQPIGGDFGFCGELAAFYAMQDVWQTDVARFGIDIWMTTSAINEGYSVVQAHLGTKIHEAKDPSIDLAPMSGQVISTLFYLIGKYEKNWMGIDKSEEVQTVDGISEIPKLESVPVSLDKLKREFVEGFHHFEPLYQQVLAHENFMQLKGKVEHLEKKGRFDFPDELWAKTVYDFAFIYQTWSRNRRRLVDMIAPLYFGKVGAYCNQVTDMNSEEAEEVIEKEAQQFEKLKPYLLEKFTRWDQDILYRRSE